MKNKYDLTPEENIFVAKRNIVDYLWKSAKLEGLAVTFPQTEAIFNGLTTANVKVNDVIAINNLKYAWQFVLETVDCQTDYPHICHINKLVGGDNLILSSGYLRQVQVSIGGTSWRPEIPDENSVKTQLKALEKIESPTERAIEVMLYCMRSQLFIDGNKRTGMLAGNHVMIKNGCGVISVPIEEQPEFRELLIKLYETGSTDKIKKFIYDKCIDGIDFRSQKLTQTEKSSSILTARKKLGR